MKDYRRLDFFFGGGSHLKCKNDEKCLKRKKQKLSTASSTEEFVEDVYY